MVECGLLTFVDTHFEVHTVAVNIDFYWVETIEHVAVVVVHVSNGVFIHLESVVEQCLVVQVAFLHLQDAFKYGRGIYGIAYPCDVSDVVGLTLVEVEIDVHLVVGQVDHTVAYYQRIAVAPGVHLFNEEALVFFVLFWYEFLGAQQVDK